MTEATLEGASHAPSVGIDDPSFCDRGGGMMELQEEGVEGVDGLVESPGEAAMDDDLGSRSQDGAAAADDGECG